MQFSKEQVLNFSNNWKQYHREGKHKKRPVVVESGLPETNPYYFKPQVHMRSDLTLVYHIAYNFLRNLPLERGIQLERSNPRILADLRYKIGNIDYIIKGRAERPELGWGDNINNRLVPFRAVFGEQFDEYMLAALSNKLNGRIIKKPVDTK